MKIRPLANYTKPEVKAGLMPGSPTFKPSTPQNITLDSRKSYLAKWALYPVEGIETGNVSVFTPQGAVTLTGTEYEIVE
jgi:hypothetical protein